MALFFLIQTCGWGNLCVVVIPGYGSHIKRELEKDNGKWVLFPFVPLSSQHFYTIGKGGRFAFSREQDFNDNSVGSKTRALAPLIRWLSQEMKMAATPPGQTGATITADNIPAVARQENENAPLVGELQCSFSSALLIGKKALVGNIRPVNICRYSTMSVAIGGACEPDPVVICKERGLRLGLLNDRDHTIIVMCSNLEKCLLELIVENVPFAYKNENSPPVQIDNYTYKNPLEYQHTNPQVKYPGQSACPLLNCNFTGLFQELSDHFTSKYWDSGRCFQYNNKAKHVNANLDEVNRKT
ncbi:Aminotransferase-like mobile domain-containing protein [Artemisia annua]|uniref:Aminotransferase-like mobile domain-containing protein n=1 Tax=Artemisia annua TaxID=35608 RepID=A0A2U1LTF0_ARTAN|nr:Aminotransferase-like mobile domain-containing protein [Artemisia annua]